MPVFDMEAVHQIAGVICYGLGIVYYTIKLSQMFRNK